MVDAFARPIDVGADVDLDMIVSRCHDECRDDGLEMVKLTPASSSGDSVADGADEIVVNEICDEKVDADAGSEIDVVVFHIADEGNGKVEKADG